MKKLRLYYKEGDKIGKERFCEGVLNFLQEIGISGVTVFKTIYSYGKSRHISSIMEETESYNMGMRADIIDEDDKIYDLIKKLQGKGFLMAVSDCEVM